MFGSFQPLKNPHQIPSTSRQSPAGDEDLIEDIIPPTDSDEEGAPIIPVNIIHPLLRIRKFINFYLNVILFSFLQHSRRAFTPEESAAMLTLCSSLIYAGRCTQAQALEELKKTPEGCALLLQLQSRMGESYKKKIADRLRAEVRKRRGVSSKKFLSIQFKTLQLLLHVSFTFWGLFCRT